MKKVFSLVLVGLLLLTSLPVFAQENAPAISVTTELADQLYYGEMAKIKCTITNPADAVGAKAKLYLDGNLIAGAGADYFVIGSKNSENFDFHVPETLDVKYQHTVLLELICDNGQSYYSSQVFTVSNRPAFSMTLYSVPQGVNAGHELYFGIKFNVPAGKVYKLFGSGYVRGAEIPGSKRELVIYNGMQIVVPVPASMNATDPSDFSFVYKVQSEWPVSSNLKAVTVEYDVTKLTALKKVEPVIVTATVLQNTTGYAYASLSGYVTSVPAGIVVEYLNPDNSHSMKSAKVKLPSGTLCWVPMSAIRISTTNYTIKDVLTNEEKEAFVNGQGYDSKTNYMVWVNKQRQILVLFSGSQYDWKVEKVYPVATGKNATPTPTRVCEYQYKTRWVTDTYICDPVLSLFEAYAIHNQPVSHSGYVLDKTIGNPASAGCIRMLAKDVQELYSILPRGSRVVLY